MEVMNRSLTLASILIASFIFAAVALGQQRAITDDEYEETVHSATALSEKRIRRVRTVVETRTQGRLTSRSEHVEEYLPPELERFVDTVRAGDLSSTEEIIQIGRFGYQKKDLTPWVEWTGRPERGPWLRISEVSHYPVCEAKNGCTYTLQSALLEGAVVRLVSGKDEYGEGSLFASNSVKVWIAGDGALARAELIETRGPANEWVRKQISTWEYDPPGLKIEPPIK